MVMPTLAPRNPGINETGPTSLLQTDIARHYSILQVEFARKFNGPIKTPNLFVAIKGKNASSAQSSHAAETNNHILIRSPVSSEFVAAPGIRTIFLNGTLEIKKNDQKIEHSFTIQVIPGTTTDYSQAKYLVLVHTNKEFSSFHSRKYINSLGEMIKQGGKLPLELIEDAANYMIKKNGL